MPPRLPNANHAIVPREKITEYLLAHTHPQNQHKAAFFERMGFTAEQWKDLADALYGHAGEHPVMDQYDTIYGTWYTVEGELRAPSGMARRVRSVWFIDAGAANPRFVTAYPLSRRRA